MTTINSLTEFVAGNKAIAFDVNNNFEQLKDGHNEHETRVTSLEDEVIKKDGSVSFTSTLDLDENKISNIANGENNYDAINLKQLNESINNIDSSQPLYLPYSVNSGVASSSGYANFINKVSDSEISFDFTSNLEVTFPNGNRESYDRLTNISSISSNETYYIIIEKNEINGTVLTGTVEITEDSATITGTNTLFTTELSVGDKIQINSEIKTIKAITDDTTLTVDEVFEEDLSSLSIINANPIAKAVTTTITEDYTFPDSALDGDYHLDISIKPYKPYKYDDTNGWSDTQFIKLGEVTKYIDEDDDDSDSDITESILGTPISYAFNGMYISPKMTAVTTASTATILLHNIGSNKIEEESYVICNVSDTYYEKDDEIIGLMVHSNSYAPHRLTPCVTNTTIQYITGITSGMMVQRKSDGYMMYGLTTDYDWYIKVVRSF